MVLNPPPEGYRASRRLPFVGVIAVVVGIYFAVKALRPDEVPDSGQPPRHASGEETSVRDAIKLILSLLVGAAPPVCGGGSTQDCSRSSDWASRSLACRFSEYQPRYPS